MPRYSDEFEFVTERPLLRKNGFDIRDIRDASDETIRALVRRPDISFFPFAPMGQTAPVYRLLAETPATEEGILLFANQYGFLLADRERSFRHVDGGTLLFEPVARWYEEIAQATERVRLWDAIGDGDTMELRRYIRWEGKKAVRYLPASLRSSPKKLHGKYTRWAIPVASADYAREIFSSFKPGDLVKPAMVALLMMVNGKLVGNVIPKLLWDHRRTRPVVQTMPLSLLGAAYLQFSLAILNNRRCRQCEVCGKWIAPEGPRSDRKTCSNTCRTLAYRHRQEEARELHRQGDKPQSIAKKLETTIDVINKWITKEKAR